MVFSRKMALHSIVIPSISISPPQLHFGSRISMLADARIKSVSKLPTVWPTIRIRAGFDGRPRRREGWRRLLAEGVTINQYRRWRKVPGGKAACFTIMRNGLKHPELIELSV
jgi:hypothetical protein